MKETFDELYKFARLCYRNSEWAQGTSLKQRVEELQKEVKELREAVGKDNFKEELGDVFWDALALVVISEEEGLFSAQELLTDVHEKFKKRKPFLLTGKKVSKEEELRIWNEVKKKEKQK